MFENIYLNVLLDLSDMSSFLSPLPLVFLTRMVLNVSASYMTSVLSKHSYYENPIANERPLESWIECHEAVRGQALALSSN